MTLLNTSKLIFLKNKNKNDSIPIDTTVVKSLCKLKLSKNSFYKEFLMQELNPLIIKKQNFQNLKKNKIKNYKSWSFREFMTAISLLKNILKRKKTFSGTFLKKKKGGGLGLFCQPKNTNLSTSSSRSSFKRSKFDYTFSNLPRFELFLPHSQLKKLSDQKKVTCLKVSSQSKRFQSLLKINILKLKIFRFRYRRTKRLINIVGGFNNYPVEKKHEAKIYQKRIKN